MPLPVNILLPNNHPDPLLRPWYRDKIVPYALHIVLEARLM